jgi:hypothetical protein
LAGGTAGALSRLPTLVVWLAWLLALDLRTSCTSNDALASPGGGPPAGGVPTGGVPVGGDELRGVFGRGAMRGATTAPELREGTRSGRWACALSPSSSRCSCSCEVRLEPPIDTRTLEWWAAAELWREMLTER